MNNEEKFKAFLSVAKVLNKQFNLTPILYGSLGLYRVLNIDRETGDIDVLIVDEYVQDKWLQLQYVMIDLGYLLKDEHEHEFIKGNQEIAFATQSDLLKVGGVDPDGLRVATINGVSFRELTAENYLFFYQTIYSDDYRRQKKGKADQEKIRLIKNHLSNE